MERLTAALLSCPIPANYGLATGDRDSNFCAEFRPFPRLCAAASLAALGGLTSPSAAADASSSSCSSSSERTPEMLQERGGACASQQDHLSGASPTDVLLLQAASNAAAAAAAANDTTATGGVLLPPAGGNQQQQQRRLELLRKALHEHTLGSGTDAYASSSSMSLRSVSTQASSLPDAAASSKKRSLAPLTSTATTGHSGFPGAASVDSPQCSPFSSPSSSASPSVSSPARPPPLPSHATASNDMASPQSGVGSGSPSSEEAAAAAERHRLTIEDRCPSPGKAIAELCSAVDTLSATDRNAVAAAVMAATTAAADGVAGGMQQQQQQSEVAANGAELPHRVADTAPQSAAEVSATVAAAVDGSTNTAPAAEVLMTAAATAPVLASVLASEAAATAADRGAVAAEGMSEAAGHGWLAVAAGGELVEAASTGSKTLALSSRRVSYEATKQVENEVVEQPRKEEVASHTGRTEDNETVLQLNVACDALLSCGGGIGSVKDDGAVARPSAENIVAAVPQSLTTGTAADSVASAAAVAAAVATAASLTCSDTTAVAACSSVPRETTSAAVAATIGDSRPEALSAADSRTERNTRKKRPRDSTAVGSRRGSVASAAAAAASLAPAAAADGLAGAADMTHAAAAAEGASEELQTQKQVEDSCSGEKTGAATGGAPYTGAGSREKLHAGRKKEKRSTAAGGAASRAASDVGLGLDTVTSTASAAGDMREQSDARVQGANADMCATDDSLLQERTAAARSGAGSAGGGGLEEAAEALGTGDSLGSLTEEESGVPVAATAAADSTAAARGMEGGDNASAAAAAPMAKRKNVDEGGGHGKGKRVCSVPDTGHASKSYSQDREGCEITLSEQIGYLAATTYFTGRAAAAAKGGAGGATAYADRGEPECSTVSCSSRNSSGELLVFPSSLSVDCLQQEQSVLQELQEKQNDGKQTGQVAAGDTGCREPAVACGLDDNGTGQHPETALAGDKDVYAESNGIRGEEKQTFSEDSALVANKAALDERRLRQKEEEEEEERTALSRHELKQDLGEAVQQQQHDERDGVEHEEQQPRVVAQEREDQQLPEAEEEEGMVQEAGSCFFVENERSSASWAKVEENSCVPPLHAYKSLSWTEGFSLPLGKIGRQKLLRQVRLKYHRNREHWRAKLHEKGFDVTSLPRMGVEQLWAVAQQMDLFDVACIIAHEHATRRQHRGGGGGCHGATVTGYHQQQQGPPDGCGGSDVADAAVVAAGLRGVGGRGGEADAVAAPTLLNDAAACMEATLNDLPSLVQAGASLRDVCADKALKNALALLADNAATAAAAAALPYASNSAHTEQGERRGGFQQRSRGGAATKEVPFLHSMAGSSASLHGSSSPQGRTSRTRSRAKAEESRHTAAAAGAGKAAHGRRDAAAEAVAAAVEEDRDDDGQGGGSTEEMYEASLGAAGTERTEEEEGDVSVDHPLLLLQEDEVENAENLIQDDFKESALLLLQQEAQREELFAEEASTREEEGEGGRGFLGEPEHGIRANQEDAATALAAAAAAAAAERRTPCALIQTESGGVEMAGEATTTSIAAVAESAASGWPYRGTTRRNKKKMRQEQMPSGGSVGELLSKVCAEALREAVACATDAAGRRYNFQAASSAACLRALGLAQATAATTEAAPAPAAGTEAVAATLQATGASQTDAAAAGVENEKSGHDAELQETHTAAAAVSCSHLQKNKWNDVDGGMPAAYVTQQQQLQNQRQQRPQHVESNADEDKVCSRDTGERVRLCATSRQQEGKADRFRDGCGSVAAGFDSSETEELALFLQQQLAASASTCAAIGRASCGSGELYSHSENGVTSPVAADASKDRKAAGVLELEQPEHTYEGSSSNSSGAAPARVGKARQRSQREKQRGEKDRQRSAVDHRQVKLKEVQHVAEETAEDIRSVYGDSQSRTEASDVALAAGDVATLLGSSRLSTVSASLRMTRSGAAPAATVAATRSPADATSLAAAVGDLFWMARGVSGQELKREQRKEGVRSQSLEREMLDEIAAVQNQDEKERKEAVDLAETRRCMRDALSEIYIQLNNGLRGTTSTSPRTIDRESGQKDRATEGELCCDFSVEAGGGSANSTRAAAAFAADGTQETLVPAEPVAEAKASSVSMNGGCRKNTYLEREWEGPFREESGGDRSSTDRSPCNADNCSSYCHMNSIHNGGRETAVRGETPSAFTGGRAGEELYKRNARAREYLRMLVAERLQQRVNHLQGQLDEVKAQLRELVKPNGAEETLYDAVLADEATQYMLTAADTASAGCESRSSLPAEGDYCSCSVTTGG